MNLEIDQSLNEHINEVFTQPLPKYHGVYNENRKDAVKCEAI